MKYNKLTRRFLLQGVGGSLLTLPLLPSVMPKAHAALAPKDKFLVMLGSGHGGTGEFGDWIPKNVIDSNSMLSNHTLFPSGGENNIDYIIRHAKLNALLTADPSHAGGNVDSGLNRLSYILGSFFNPYLNKMNLFRGIDGGTFYSGHSRGMFSGNIQAAVNNPTAAARMAPWPSLDQFLANSPKFYTDQSLISQKTVTNDITMGHKGDGTLIPATAWRLNTLYTALFDKYDKTITPAELAKRNRKEYLVDRVYNDYKRFLTGAHGPARRISSVDKLRVEEHVANLYDIQNKYKNVINSCGDVAKITDNSSFGLYHGPTSESFDIMSDMLASAFSCGATRLFNVYMLDNPLRYAGNYHQDIAHGSSTDSDAQLTHNKSFRWQAENVVAKIVKKLDAISVDGQSGSILDNGLVMWTHECGPVTHNHDSIGFTTFGSLGGHFKTGNYVDYRNLENRGFWGSREGTTRPGIPIQRMWANIIQGFGFNRSEYERNGKPGYSDTSENVYPKSPTRENKGHNAYPARVMNSLSDKLPIIT